MDNQAEEKDPVATVWPPPIEHYTHPPKPLSKGEVLLVRWRWLYTLVAPLMLIEAILIYSEHILYRDIIFAFNTLMCSALTIRAWQLFARLQRDKRQLQHKLK